MRPATAFRLGMLAHGFVPTLNDCKRALVKGWPRKRVTEAEVLAWERSALVSTGLRLNGDLAVIDADTTEPTLVAALAKALDRLAPALFTHGLVRHAGGVKEAWFARVDRPFVRLASRLWVRGPADLDDPTAPKHRVECFGALGTRQFGVDGPHGRDPFGRVVSTYQFTGGASPATVPRDALPVLPQEAYGQACDLFDGLAQAAGLTVVHEARRGRHGAPARIFELDPETVVETADFGPMTVTDLEALTRARHRNPNASRTLRCSGTFHDPVRVRTDSHLIHWGRHGLGIWDAMTEQTWHRRERAPSDLFRFLGRLRETDPFI